jgi:DNA polymerase I-like protein with 3'-5' exonuclease and polymerase domains
MIPASIEAFSKVVILDTEYVHEPGEQYDPVALGVMELGTDAVQVYCREEVLQWDTLPFPCDESTLIVCYNAAAESGFLHVLGLGMPVYWLDLMAENRVLRNVCIAGKFLQKFAVRHPEVFRPNRDVSLLEAAEFFGLEGGNGDVKEVSRELVLSRQWETGNPDVWRQILAYCASDVRLTARLFVKMEPHIANLPGALVRGRYVAEQGRAEQRGIPVDRETLERLQRGYKQVLREYRERVDPDNTRLTPKGRISQRWLESKLASAGLTYQHPRTSTGKASTRAKCLAETAADAGDSELQQIAQWAELLSIFLEGRDGALRLPVMGRDGRVRYSQFPFSSHTGRSLGSGRIALMQLPKWMRGLVQPLPGEVLIMADFSAEEFAVGAGLSGDARMRAAYIAGDPYVEMARMSGVLTPDLGEGEVRRVRKLFKDLTLGRMYGLGFQNFRQRSGAPYGQAVSVWRFFEREFAQFREWQRRTVAQARQRGWIMTQYGWKAQVFPSTRDTSLLNWSIQAGAGDVLRIAVLMLARAGLDLLTTVHDSVLVSVPEGLAEECSAKVVRVMREAAEIAVGIPIRVDVQQVHPGERLLTVDTWQQWQRIRGLLEGGIHPL